MPIAGFEVQGHRGARGLAPENTLAGFEIALDVGVDSVETDVHLSRDDVPVLIHDPHITGPLCSLARPGAPPVETQPLVRSLALEQLRCYRVHGPMTRLAPLAERWAADPFGIPTLAELFAFAAEYTRAPEKTGAQQARARRLIFDIELKRVPYMPETIGDGFTGDKPALLERKVVDAIRTAGVLERCRVRSFDHRAVLAIKDIEQNLATGVLLHNTYPAEIPAVLGDADAQFYCPDFRFVDGEVVRQVIDAGGRVIPYTVNESAVWERLLGFGVHGVTTDVPDQLLHWLRQ